MVELTANYLSQPNTTWGQLSHLPGRKGLPLIGITHWFVKDYYNAIQKYYEQYGLVSRMHFGMHEGVLAIGPECAQQLLLDTDRNFSNRMGYDDVNNWFNGAILFRDFEDHRLHRRIHQNAFKSEAMHGYIATINETSDKILNTWGQVEDFHFLPQVRQLLMTVSARVFYGLDTLGEDAEKLSKAFLQMLDGLISVVKIDMPPFKYHYGLKGKQFVSDYLSPLIQQRRTQEGNDFMSYMAKEKDDNGEYISDAELTTHLAFLFFASYDTTTAASSHMMMHLAMNQDLQEQLREESLALGKTQLDYDDLEKMSGIEHTFLEALRLYPSASMYLRRSIRDCEMGGHHIPANTLVYFSPIMTHRLEEWWDKPETFDPNRFAKGREEHKRHPYCYVPFGGGAHKCVGMNFAAMNAKLFIHQLLMKYRFKTPDNYKVKLQVVPLPKPVDDLPLILEHI